MPIQTDFFLPDISVWILTFFFVKHISSLVQICVCMYAKTTVKLLWFNKVQLIVCTVIEYLGCRLVEV